MNTEADSKGIKLALFAYIWWGLAPIFWRQLSHVPAVDIVLARMLTASPPLILFLLLRGTLRDTLSLMKWDRTLLLVTAGGILISMNWSIFMLAINSDNIKQASLGYYLSPLVNVLMGVLFFAERPRFAQWLAIIIAALGIFWVIWDYGRTPWYSLGLAFSWGIYSAVRKFITLPAMAGNTIESIMMLPLALLYMVFTGSQTSFGQVDLLTDSYLSLAGIVTVIPLLAYVTAARLTSLTNLGLIFYVGPTLQLIVATFIFNEAISSAEWVAFTCIAIALIINSAESIQRRIKHR